jgi:hypothetical protein
MTKRELTEDEMEQLRAMETLAVLNERFDKKAPSAKVVQEKSTSVSEKRTSKQQKHGPSKGWLQAKIDAEVDVAVKKTRAEYENRVSINEGCCGSCTKDTTMTYQTVTIPYITDEELWREAMLTAMRNFECKDVGRLSSCDKIADAYVELFNSKFRTKK